jgi:hypothetical protein
MNKTSCGVTEIYSIAALPLYHVAERQRSTSSLKSAPAPGVPEAKNRVRRMRLSTNFKSTSFACVVAELRGTVSSYLPSTSVSFLDESFQLRPVEGFRQVNTKLVGEVERQVVFVAARCRLLLYPTALVVLPVHVLLLLALRYLPP